MRARRVLAILACVAVLLVTASWLYIGGTGPYRLAATGEHDGISCGATAVTADGTLTQETTIPCALQVTPLFLGILLGMAAGGVAGIVAVARHQKERLAAASFALLAALVLLEAWLGRATLSGTLNDRRVYVHVGVLALGALALAFPPRDRSLMREAPAPADS